MGRDLPEGGGGFPRRDCCRVRSQVDGPSVGMPSRPIGAHQGGHGGAASMARRGGAHLPFAFGRGLGLAADSAVKTSREECHLLLVTPILAKTQWILLNRSRHTPALPTDPNE